MVPQKPDFIRASKSFPDRTEIKILRHYYASWSGRTGEIEYFGCHPVGSGEQSSRVSRGAKMEDVIFGGTAKRGPVGFARGFAHSG